MKIYLAGPMRGAADLNRPVFRQAAQSLRAMGHEVFNPGEEEGERAIRQIFRDDCVWICEHAEAVALLPGWEVSRGARMEKALAEALGIAILYM